MLIELNQLHAPPRQHTSLSSYILNIIFRRQDPLTPAVNQFVDTKSQPSIPFNRRVYSYLLNHPV